MHRHRETTPEECSRRANDENRRAPSYDIIDRTCRGCTQGIANEQGCRGPSEGHALPGDATNLPELSKEHRNNC